MSGAARQAVKELLVAALRKLYERLNVTRGQIALAMELYVMEDAVPEARDPVSAVSEAMARLGADASAALEGEELLVKVASCGGCILPGVCPLPFYLAAYVKKATGKRVLLTEEKQETEGYCSFRFKTLDRY
uniref:Transcriptional regulator n=1 Tax=Thermofilum pendens TaxID=2269 RepID=A0A7C4B991_THEPE